MITQEQLQLLKDTISARANALRTGPRPPSPEFDNRATALLNILQQIQAYRVAPEGVSQSTWDSFLATYKAGDWTLRSQMQLKTGTLPASLVPVEQAPVSSTSDSSVPSDSTLNVSSDTAIPPEEAQASASPSREQSIQTLTILGVGMVAAVGGFLYWYLTRNK